MEKRKSIPPKIQLEVWNRDNWTCRYCGEGIFFGPTMKLLDNFSPFHGYYDKHGSKNKMALFLMHRWASVDHVNPFSNGRNNSIGNYVTACWECNYKFKNKIVGKGKPAPKDVDEVKTNFSWDGMSSLYLIIKQKT